MSFGVWNDLCNTPPSLVFLPSPSHESCPFLIVTPAEKRISAIERENRWHVFHYGNVVSLELFLPIPQEWGDPAVSGPPLHYELPIVYFPTEASWQLP